MMRRRASDTPQKQKASSLELPTVASLVPLKRHSSITTSTPTNYREPSASPRAIPNKNNLRSAPSVSWSSPIPSYSGYDYYSNYNSKSKKSSNRMWSWLPFLPAILFLTVPWIPCRLQAAQVHGLQREITGGLLEQKSMIKRMDSTTDDIRSINVEIDQLTKENHRLFQSVSGVDKSNVDLLEEYEQVEQEEERLLQRIEALEKEIKKNSEKEVLARFGGGPHRLRVNLRDTKRNVQSYFIMQLAPLTEMPHAVHHFLQMVDLQLWDGLALIHGQGDAVLRAMAMNMQPNIENPLEWSRQRFVQANLTSMAFTEIAPQNGASATERSNRKYSIAFSGRPGGPDFYINLADQLEDDHAHESVFGHVVEGFDTLDGFYHQHAPTTKKQAAGSTRKSRSRVEMLQIETIRIVEDEQKE